MILQLVRFVLELVSSLGLADRFYSCASENHEGIKRCYIMTIGCLDKYRRLGVGTTLLNYILETAKADGCVKATLHVQVSFNSLYDRLVIESNSQSQ